MAGKWLRKMGTLLIAAAAVLGAVSCGNGQGNYDMGYYRGTEPVTLTVAWTENGSVVDTQDTPTLVKAQEMTNIGLKNILPKNVTDWQQALGMLVAGDKEPDIIHLYTQTAINQYTINGTLRPLDELIEEYAPNIKRFFEENPDLREVTQWKDGKIYFLPCYTDGEFSNGWFIRKDWLDRLGLKEPESVEEYYQVLKAFKTQDPNGNGIADEIPYFNRKAGVDYTESVTCLLQLWDTNQGIMEKNGTIVYAPCEPEFIEAISNIAKWYKEGLIDPEIYTRGSGARDELLGRDVGGSTYDWFGSTALYNNRLRDEIPGFSFVPMAPPSGANYDSRQPTKDAGWGISAKSENAVEAIRYMDFWFSPEGRILANYGIEGETYDMVDGKPQLKENIINSHDEGSVVDVLNTYGAQLSMAYHQDFEYERQWLTPVALAGIDDYMNNGYLKKYVNRKYTLNEEDSKKATELLATLSDYVSDMEQKWVLGELDIASTYNEFLSTLHNMQVDELIAIHRRAYEAAGE